MVEATQLPPPPVHVAVPLGPAVPCPLPDPAAWTVLAFTCGVLDCTLKRWFSGPLSSGVWVSPPAPGFVSPTATRMSRVSSWAVVIAGATGLPVPFCEFTLPMGFVTLNRE